MIFFNVKSILTKNIKHTKFNILLEFLIILSKFNYLYDFSSYVVRIY